MNTTGNYTRSKGFNDTDMRERIKCFYGSGWPFKRIATTDLYKSTQSCISSVTAAIRAVKLNGKVVTKVFRDPQIEGNPEVVYICRPEFAHRNITPEEWYEERDAKLREETKMAEEKKIEETKSVKRNWNEIVIDFYTSNDNERTIELLEGENVHTARSNATNAVKRNTDISGVTVHETKTAVVLRRTVAETASVEEVEEEPKSGTFVWNTPTEPDDPYTRVIADLKQKCEAKLKEVESLRKLISELEQAHA